MRPLTSSLTKKQLAETLDLPPELVDALLDSGRVLCHVTRGEIRVPLAQLEAFFREALVNVYRAAAAAGAGHELGVVSSGPVVVQPAPPRVEEARAPEPEPEPEAEAEREPEPALAAAPATPPELITQHSQPLPEPLPPAPQPTPQRPDQRIASRYVPLRQLNGIFGETKFSIMQLSATGLRIRHNEPLMPGDEAKLSFALVRPARSVVVRARVVWTSIARSGEERFSISGLRIIEHQERLEQAITTLRGANELQPERRNESRRAVDGLTFIGGISDEEMALVTGAVQKFADDPVEASRWYSRARFALSDETVRRAAPQRPRDREEVLGIWEYLDRRVDIAKIAGVVTWMRSTN